MYTKHYQGENFKFILLSLTGFLAFVGVIIFSISDVMFEPLWQAIKNNAPLLMDIPYIINAQKYSEWPERSAAYLSVLLILFPLLLVYCLCAYKPPLGDYVPRVAVLKRAGGMMFIGLMFLCLACILTLLPESSSMSKAARTDALLTSNRLFFILCNSLFYATLVVIMISDSILMAVFSFKSK